MHDEESLGPYLPKERTAKTGHTGRIPKADLYFHWAHIFLVLPCHCSIMMPGHEVIKTISMLNSAGHVFYHTQIHVKMPTIVDILTFISIINTTSERF